MRCEHINAEGHQCALLAKPGNKFCALHQPTKAQTTGIAIRVKAKIKPVSIDKPEPQS